MIHQLDLFSEIWRPIKGYEGIYEVSNLGRVKSLARKTNNQYGKTEIILKPAFDNDGYVTITLNKSGKAKTLRVHLLVWDSFGEEKRDGMVLQVDHKNDNRADARFENLRLLDFRANTCKARQRNRKTDLPVGVYLSDRGKPFKVSFSQNGVRKYLGRFATVEEASQAYQNALKESQCQNQ